MPSHLGNIPATVDLLLGVEAGRACHETNEDAMTNQPAPAPYRLSIDFGTSNTAASIQTGQGEARPLRLGTRSDLIPSAVTWHDGRLKVGDEANRLARLDPAAHEPTPKRRLGEQVVLLGGELVRPQDMVSAVLYEVAEKARRAMNGAEPGQLVLTHPQVWQPYRQQLLADAATAVGLPRPVTLVGEPVAAVWHYAATTRIDPGSKLALVDFGGGTVDVAVLQRDKKSHVGFAVLAQDGRDPLGGTDFDDLLYEWVHQQLRAQGRGELADELRSAGRLREQLTLREQVREAKHALSQFQSTTIPVIIGAESAEVLVTAREFEDLIGARVAEAVDLTGRTLQAAGVHPDQLCSLFLTGGSTLIPLVQREFQRLSRGRVGTMDDPKSVTSLGALRVPVSGLRTLPAGPVRVAPQGEQRASWNEQRVPGNEQRVPPPERQPEQRPKKRYLGVKLAGLAIILVLVIVIPAAIALSRSGTTTTTSGGAVTPSPGTSTPASGPSTPVDTRPALKEGDSGEDVKAAQRLLNRAGPYQLLVDGEFGPQTTNAVLDFQTQNSLGATGVIDATTWSALDRTEPSPGPSSPTGEQPVCTSDPSSADCALATSLMSWVWSSSCVREAGSEFLTCSPISPRLVSTHQADPSTKVFVRRYADLATLRADSERFFTTYVDDADAEIGKKPLEPPSRTTWGEGGRTDDGALYTVIDGSKGAKSPTIMWSMEDKGILLIAQASAGSMETLYSWWTGA